METAQFIHLSEDRKHGKGESFMRILKVSLEMNIDWNSFAISLRPSLVPFSLILNWCWDLYIQQS